jgi:elongation factor G
MGELHIDIYMERMKREYNCECVTGKPQVAYRETVTEPTKFSYTHKKQSGGAGQYGKVIGFIEPIRSDPDAPYPLNNEFEDQTVGLNVPSQFIPSIERGFLEGCEKGRLVGAPVVGARFVLEDGQAHAVDSSDLAFRLAGLGALRESRQLCIDIYILSPRVVPFFVRIHDVIKYFLLTNIHLSLNNSSHSMSLLLHLL